MNRIPFFARKFPRLNAVLLALVGMAIFLFPALPRDLSHYFYPPVFTAIFLSAAFSFKGKRKPVVIFALGLTVVFWIATLSNQEVLKTAVRCLQIGFFVFLVAGLIKEISSQAAVNSTVIVDAITGYLLLGFAYSLCVTVVAMLIPGAYHLTAGNASIGVDRVSESIYYTFVTYSTTGYGDILPLHPVAKSLAILVGISGQLYIAIIIAMLVGKYSSIKS